MIRFSVLLSCAVLAGGIAVGVVPGAGASAATRPATDCQSVNFTPFSQAQETAALRYWTSQRMAAAEPQNPATEPTAPASQLKTTTSTVCVSPSTATGAPAVAAAAGVGATPNGSFGGYPAEGKLFISNLGGSPGTCTGSVVNGTNQPNNESLVLTAAHCILGSHDGHEYINTSAIFAPKYARGKSPYGRWTATGFAWTNDWMKCTNPDNCPTHPEYDYVILVMAELNGHHLGSVTGQNGWEIDTARTVDGVRLVGYPCCYAPKNKQGGRIPVSKQLPLTTVGTAVTVTEGGQLFRRENSPGFTDGTSGSPWLIRFGGNVGIVIADLGGYEGGGSKPSPSYAPFWNGTFRNVMKKAVQLEG
jgi:hypothetical protein